MTHTCALLKGLICLVSKVARAGIASGQASLGAPLTETVQPARRNSSCVEKQQPS